MHGFETMLENLIMRADSIDPARFFESGIVNSEIPKANILELDSGYEIQVALPGFSRSDISVDVTKGSLKISSNEIFDKSQENISDKYTVKEFGFTGFTRTWNLPENVIHENIEASFDAGILNVNIPYADGNENITRKINIS